MGEFAKRAKTVLEPWEEELERQKEKLYKKVPATEDEASAEALARISELRRKSFMAGYMTRRLRQQQETVKELVPKDTLGVPGREIAVTMPETKEAGVLDAFTRPAREAAEDVKMRAMKDIDERLSSATRTTKEPGTVPWYYPMAAMTVPNAFAAGFQQAERDADTERLSEINERLLKAQEEFERALKEEYTAAKSVKAASVGELADGLAKLHVKCAEGELNEMLGAYLALAALLGQGAHMTAHEWVAKRDPKRQKLKALKRAIRKRMRTYTPPVQIEPPSMELAKTPD